MDLIKGEFTMDLIKVSVARAVANRITCAIQSNMIDNCQTSEKIKIRAIQDRELIWKRCQLLQKDMSFQESLNKAQFEFAENVILGFLNSKKLLDRKKITKRKIKKT